MELTKKCLLCGKTIIKRQNESLKDWNDRHKYCSRECTNKARIGKPSWNKGKKLHYDAWNKNKKMSEEFCEINRKSHLGQIAWNKNKEHLKIRNEKHYRWRGDDVGYGAIHSWVRRKKGKPEICIDCGATVQDRKLQWSNIDHKYRRDINDYVGRCSSCHKKYDINMKLYLCTNTYIKI